MSGWMTWWYPPSRLVVVPAQPAPAARQRQAVHQAAAQQQPISSMAKSCMARWAKAAMFVTEKKGMACTKLIQPKPPIPTQAMQLNRLKATLAIGCRKLPQVLVPATVHAMQQLIFAVGSAVQAQAVQVQTAPPQVVVPAVQRGALITGRAIFAY